MNDRLSLSVLKPEATSAEVHAVATQVMEKAFAGLIVAPVWTARVATMLSGSGARVGTVVGFPHGAGKATLKAIEATSSIKEGANEVYISAHLPNLITRNFEATRGELMEIVRAARATRREVAIQIIIESPLLLTTDPTGESIAIACRSIRESGCDGVVTASGFHPAGGASGAAIDLLKRHGEGLTIIAMGSIPNASVAQSMIEQGSMQAVIDHAKRVSATT